MRFELSDTELADITSALSESDLKPKLRRKLMALKMRASSLGVTERSISKYTKEYRSGGISATMEDRAYSPDSSLNPYLKVLEEEFRENPIGNAKQARLRIIKLTGIALSPSQTRHGLSQGGANSG